MERFEIAELAQDIDVGSYTRPHEGRSYIVLTVTDIYHNRHEISIPCSAIQSENMLIRLLEQIRKEAESELKAMTTVPGFPIRWVPMKLFSHEGKTRVLETIEPEEGEILL